jgi:UDP-N-acetylglucosamine 1-carboxyvinyltransferase
MNKIVIKGNKPLSGEITIGGAKNSAVALIPAAILCDGEVTIDNIPNISDIDALSEILIYLGATVKKDKKAIKINTTKVRNKEIPENISNKLRASYYFFGALLSKFKHVEMYFPGGCKIGARPINLHLKAFEALGATVTIEDSKFIVSADKLKGAHIYFDVASVGATINVLLAASKAEGTTVIENAAKEPEIVNVATFLNQMGAKITGAGTSEIKIEGVKELRSCYTEVIPDRIEAGTYIILGALVGENLKINNIIPEHIEALTLKLKEMGVKLEEFEDYVIVNKADTLKSVNVKTQVFPGFPTDLGQPITTLLTQTSNSKLEETIYENRFGNIPYLNQMGANIKINDRTLSIKGPSKLQGCEVEATDLRAGACLLLAALKADGVTTINKIEHLLRGYEDLINKLKAVGADIEIK